MLTAEIKVNGNLVYHILAVNEGYKTGITNICKYRYEIYHPDNSGNSVSFGNVEHDRSNDSLTLIKKILDKHFAK
jgi:hypothetical protein